MTEGNGPVGEAPAANPAPEGGAAAPEAAPAPASTDAQSMTFTDPDLASYAEGKGFKQDNFESVVKSYKHMEGLVRGGNIDKMVELPGLEATPEDKSAFYSKLGKPEDPKGYELPVPEGQDTAMADWASGVFHEANLTKEQASIVAEKWNEYVAGAQEQSATQQQHSAQEAEMTLKKEWGAAFDKKSQGVELAAKQFGMDENQLLGLRQAMGPVAAMKFMDNIASKLGESPMDSGQTETGGVMTPQQAQNELAKLGTDSQFMDAWMNKHHPSHAWAVEKKASLAKMVAGQVG